MKRKHLRKSVRSAQILPLESRLLMSGTHPLTDVPVLNSLPGAPTKLYLDFDGETVMTQNGPIATTPAFSQDSDKTTFSDSELEAIKDIWARVAEAYSPFNVNVTTVNPGSLVDRVSARVLIGGNSAYVPPGVIGTSFDGGFTNPSVGNTSWVYSDRAATNTSLLALAAVHESGHGFGLKHQSGGDSSSAPIMNDSAGSSLRHVWTSGDMTLLSSVLGGYRPDGQGNDAGTATTLNVSNSAVSTGGVIEQMTDSDWFRFTTSGGSVSFKADVSQLSPTLNLGLKIVDSSGRVVAIADSARTSTNFGENVSATLAGGTYSVVVFSHGDTGDLGQYTLTGTIIGSGTVLPPAPTTVPTPTPTPTPAPAPATAPTAPSSVSAVGVSTGQIRLSWQETSTNATGFRIERSTDGLNFALVATVGASTRSFDNTGLAAGTKYYYRLQAISANGNSPYSVQVSATTLIPPAPAPTPAPITPTSTPTTSLAAPTEFSAVYIGRSSISLSWKDNAAGERGYYVEKSLDGIKWSLIKGLPANTTSYITSNNNAAGKTYQFRARAYVIVSNKTTYSDYSNSATVVMPAVLTKVITLV